MFSLTVYKPIEPWNKNKIVAQKSPFKLQQIWATRIRLKIDSKLRGCDLVALKIRDIAHGKLFSRELLLFKKDRIACSI